jgi:hypothetical protein
MTENKGVTDVTPEDADDTDEPDGLKTFDAEYVKTLKAEAKKYRQDKATLKKDFEETKKKLEALEAEKLTDTEKKELKIKELEKQLADIQGSIKVKEIDNLILKSFTGKNIIDAEAAELLVKKELEAVEDITPEAVTKAIDKLIKDKPYLVASNSVNPSSGNFAKTKNEPAQDFNSALKKLLKG